MGAGTEELRVYILRRIVPEERGHSSPCWIWLREKDRKGYARSGHGQLGRIRVHRTSYEAFVGPIPDGLQIDHLCFVTSCVNPSHLEPVTAEENNRRMCVRRGRTVGGNPKVKSPGSGKGGWQRFQTHCKNGHEYTAETLFKRADGGRGCRICRLTYSRARNRKISLKRAAARENRRGVGLQRAAASTSEAIARSHVGAVTA